MTVGYPRRKRRRRLWLTIALGVTGVIAAVGDSNLTIADTMQRARVRSEVSPVGLAFCRDLMARDYAAADGLLSSGLRALSSPDQFVTLDSAYGAVEKCSLQGGPWSDGYGPSTGYSGAQVNLQVVRHDTCVLRLDLTKEGTAWKIDTYGTPGPGGSTSNFEVPHCEEYIFPATSQRP